MEREDRTGYACDEMFYSGVGGSQRSVKIEKNGETRKQKIRWILKKGSLLIRRLGIVELQSCGCTSRSRT